MSLLHRFTSTSALLACALLPVSSFAQLSFQTHQVTQFTPPSNVVFHGDFNNDGREDLVVIVTGNQVNEYLLLSNGDGTYAAPVPVPALVQAIGDFNHDGYLDIATFSGTSTPVSIYLGKGDGTFSSPHTIPASSSDYIAKLIPVDLNHDSRTDLVEVLNPLPAGAPTTIQLYISNGDGTFTKGETLNGSTGSLANVSASDAVTGDFDGDGKPDIAIIYGQTISNSESVPTAGVIQVWYGDGAGNLGSPYLFSDPSGYADSTPFAADINNDGRSDIIAVPSNIKSKTSGLVQALSLFSGNANRTLSYKTLATSECAGLGAQNVTVADFNGDGLNDLAYDQSPCSTAGASEIVVRLGTGSGNFGSDQLVYQGTSFTPALLSTIRSSFGTRPDLAFSGLASSSSNVTLLSNSSTGSFPSCGFVSGAEGITLCSPAATPSSPVKFSIAAAGPTPMRTAAVWVDGKKVDEQLTHAFSNYSFLDASLPLATGSHAITIFGTGWDDTLQQKNFTINVGSTSSCPPVGNGVNLCSPLNQSTVSSPVTVIATSAIPGSLARMEVWIDGIKKYTETTSPTLSYSISLPAGSHRFAVFAVNTAGAKTETFDYATVQ